MLLYYSSLRCIVRCIADRQERHDASQRTLGNRQDCMSTKRPHFIEIFTILSELVSLT